VDSGRGDLNLVGGFASVASLTVSFVSKYIFWNLVITKVQ